MALSVRPRSGLDAARACRQERESLAEQVFGAVWFVGSLVAVVLVFWGLGAVIGGR